MRIRMKVAFDDGARKLAAGGDGKGLTDAEKRRFVRVGLAEEVAPRGKPKTRVKPAKPAAPAKPTPPPAPPADEGQ